MVAGEPGGEPCFLFGGGGVGAGPRELTAPNSVFGVYMRFQRDGNSLRLQSLNGRDDRVIAGRGRGRCNGVRIVSLHVPGRHHSREIGVGGADGLRGLSAVQIVAL